MRCSGSYKEAISAFNAAASPARHWWSNWVTSGLCAAAGFAGAFFMGGLGEVDVKTGITFVVC
jgi:hypothetical protein